MISDYKPIVIDTPQEYDEIELYFAHDLHKGSCEHDSKKWDSFVKEILAEPNRYVGFVGDCFDNGTKNSKTNIYEQSIGIAEQVEWVSEQFTILKDRIVAIVPGNHCERTTKEVGLYPLYDCALISGTADRYRQHFAIVDIGVGFKKELRGNHIQYRYIGYLAHKFRDTKLYNSSDFIDGIDFAAYGHDHDAKDHARSKLVYNPVRRTIKQKNIDVLNSGAFLTYGGYGVTGGYRPTTSKIYKLVLSGTKQAQTTVGFYI